MEYKGLRVTRQQSIRIRKLKSIGEIAYEFYKNAPFQYITKVDEYFVPYELVRTEDLIEMMRRLTIFTNFMENLNYPSAKQLDRMTYLDLITDYSGIDLTEKEYATFQQLIHNEKFMKTKNEFLKKLKAILATREHVPNKIEKKIVRRLKSQGKYIID